MAIPYLNQIGLSVMPIGMPCIKILFSKHIIMKTLIIDLWFSRSIILLSVMNAKYPTEIFLHLTVVYTSMWHAPGGQSRQNSRHHPPKWVPNNLFSPLFFFYDSTDTKASPWYSAGDAWFDPDEKQQLLPLSEEHMVKFVLFLWRGTYSSGSCYSVKVLCLIQPLPITDSWSWWSSNLLHTVLQEQSSPPVW